MLAREPYFILKAFLFEVAENPSKVNQQREVVL
jgi:hypothetical protein